MTTYVIAGYDHNGAFEDIVSAYEKRSDTVIIRPEDGKTLSDSIRQAFKDHPSKGDAQVIVASHGTEGGSLQWWGGMNPPIAYQYAFEALPRDHVSSISVLSCYGGMSQDGLASVPPGAVLLTEVGRGSYNMDDDFATNSKGITRPAQLMVEMLSAVNPQSVHLYSMADNFFNGEKTIPAGAVSPHMIGIGGYPPTTIELNHEVRELTRAAAHDRLNQDASGHTNTTLWKDAVDEVERRFDNPMLVPVIARKLEKGELPDNPEEWRVAYALAVTRMDLSGEFDKRVQAARDTVRDSGNKVNFDNTIHAIETTAGALAITEDEAKRDKNMQATLDMEKKELQEIVRANPGAAFQAIRKIEHDMAQATEMRAKQPPLDAAKNTLSVQINQYMQSMQDIREQLAVFPPDGENKDTRRDVTANVIVAHMEEHASSPAGGGVDSGLNALIRANLPAGILADEKLHKMSGDHKLEIAALEKVLADAGVSLPKEAPTTLRNDAPAAPASPRRGIGNG